MEKFQVLLRKNLGFSPGFFGHNVKKKFQKKSSSQIDSFCLKMSLNKKNFFKFGKNDKISINSTGFISIPRNIIRMEFMGVGTHQIRQVL